MPLGGLLIGLKQAEKVAFRCALQGKGQSLRDESRNTAPGKTSHPNQNLFHHRKLPHGFIYFISSHANLEQILKLRYTYVLQQRSGWDGKII